MKRSFCETDFPHPFDNQGAGVSFEDEDLQRNMKALRSLMEQYQTLQMQLTQADVALDQVRGTALNTFAKLTGCSWIPIGLLETAGDVKKEQWSEENKQKLFCEWRDSLPETAVDVLSLRNQISNLRKHLDDLVDRCSRRSILQMWFGVCETLSLFSVTSDDRQELDSSCRNLRLASNEIVSKKASVDLVTSKLRVKQLRKREFRRDAVDLFLELLFLKSLDLQSLFLIIDRVADSTMDRMMRQLNSTGAAGCTLPQLSVSSEDPLLKKRKMDQLEWVSNFNDHSVPSSSFSFSSLLPKEEQTNNEGSSSDGRLYIPSRDHLIHAKVTPYHQTAQFEEDMKRAKLRDLRALSGTADEMVVCSDCHKSCRVKRFEGHAACTYCGRCYVMHFSGSADVGNSVSLAHVSGTNSGHSGGGSGGGLGGLAGEERTDSKNSGDGVGYFLKRLLQVQLKVNDTLPPEELEIIRKELVANDVNLEEYRENPVAFFNLLHSISSRHSGKLTKCNANYFAVIYHFLRVQVIELPENVERSMCSLFGQIAKKTREYEPNRTNNFKLDFFLWDFMHRFGYPGYAYYFSNPSESSNQTFDRALKNAYRELGIPEDPVGGRKSTHQKLFGM